MKQSELSGWRELDGNSGGRQLSGEGGGRGGRRI